MVIGASMLAGLPTPQGAVAAGRWTNCGEFGLQGDVLVHRVKCSKGRKLVKAVFIRSQSQGPHVDVSGFSCTGKSSRGDLVVKCSKGGKRVHWRGAIS